jgi:hypothetical protein
MEPERSTDDNDRPATNFAALKPDGLTTQREYALVYAAVMTAYASRHAARSMWERAR